MKALLYYKYSVIQSPQLFREEQLILCKSLGLKGRILIADEGINGTICGENGACEEYKKVMSEMVGFEDIEWKEDIVEKQIFPKLRIVVRDEIVTLGLKNTKEDVKIKNKAEYIEPEELLEMYENKDDFVIIDGRNEYEGRIGKFRNAIVPNIKAFRELPEYINKDAEFQSIKNKTIVTYCTGGIRCEKFSALLKENGFRNVRQLRGGIHKYSTKTGGKYFDGEMYVFDGRVHIKVNHTDHVDIAECKHCKQKISRFVNCNNSQCNEQFICCTKCEVETNKSCSIECMGLVEQNKHLSRKQPKNECGCM
ncbi:rhodanese-related sulfurtransferase [Candidatus Dojkabacteria bacterium]|nr:rhodanese-related sulfurtransferase [Candidatus Dojkabacteria bacterium]